MSLKRKFVRILDEDRSADYRRMGSDVIEIYECPNADIATHVATLRAATFTGFGLTGLTCREVAAKEHAPRRNVATIEVKYSNKFSGGGGAVLRRTENIGKAVVRIIPVMSKARTPEIAGNLLWEQFPEGEGAARKIYRWVPANEDDERFWIDSRFALVIVECAVLLSSTLVAAWMALIGQTNAAACEKLGNAGAKTLLMLAPEIQVEAGDTIAMARINLIYSSQKWDSVKAEKEVIEVVNVGVSGETPVIPVPVWAKVGGEPTVIPFTEGDFSAINALATWYAT